MAVVRNLGPTYSPWFAYACSVACADRLSAGALVVACDGDTEMAEQG